MLISLAKLNTAFNLSPYDLADLRELLPTPPVIPLYRLIIDPAELIGRENEPPLEFSSELASEYAKRYAKRVFSIPRFRRRLVDHVLRHLLDLFYELELGHDSHKEWEALSARWKDGFFYAILWCYLDGRLWVFREEIYEQLVGSYVFFSMVDLEEAVGILHACIYPLRQEVKGLTRERYQEIVEKILAEPAEENHTHLANNELPPEMPADETPKKQRHMTIRVLLKDIKAEADKHGLDKKHYVSTDRTIRNWLSGATTPPSGFSEEVLKNLGSISDFAKKYIEEVVAAGSSELAANAKREVAFNDHLHSVELNSAEDAEFMRDALNDLIDRFQSGNKTKKKWRRR